MSIQWNIVWLTKCSKMLITKMNLEDCTELKQLRKFIYLEPIDNLPARASVPHGHWFMSWVFYSLSSSLLIAWESSRGCGPKRRRPGSSSWLLASINSSLAIVAIWKVNQQMEDLSFISLNKSAFPKEMNMSLKDHIFVILFMWKYRIGKSIETANGLMILWALG